MPTGLQVTRAGQLAQDLGAKINAIGWPMAPQMSQNGTRNPSQNPTIVIVVFWRGQIIPMGSPRRPRDHQKSGPGGAQGPRVPAPPTPKSRPGGASPRPVMCLVDIHFCVENGRITEGISCGEAISGAGAVLAGFGASMLQSRKITDSLKH